MLSREKREEYFVNLYRANWGSTVGLSSEKIRNFSDKELNENLRSQLRFAEATGRIPKGSADEEIGKAGIGVGTRRMERLH